MKDTFFTPAIIHYYKNKKFVKYLDDKKELLKIKKEYNEGKHLYISYKNEIMTAEYFQNNYNVKKVIERSKQYIKTIKFFGRTERLKLSQKDKGVENGR